MKDKKPKNGKKRVPRDCKEIQAVLFDHMNHELGKARSDLVSRHLKKCKDCQAQAAEMQATIDFLRRASREEKDLPTRLSDKHRERLFWSVAHPVLDWIHRYHIVVSIVLTIVILVAVVATTCRTKPRPRERSITVYIGRPEMTNRQWWLPKQDLKSPEPEGPEPPPDDE